jgi:PAS domain S-box-containing protein
MGGSASLPNHFKVYVDRLMLKSNYPGIQGVGISWQIPPGETQLPETVKRLGITMKRPGEREKPFEIWPDAPGVPRHAIVYLEPLDERNHAAIGYNMFSNPVRREAMERARDTGLAAASGKVTLVQEIDEDKQAGFLIYVPIYRGDEIPSTVEARRNRLLGFAYSPFRADDLLKTTYGDTASLQVHFAVYDGVDTSRERLLHRSAPAAESGEARFTSTRTINVAGRPWTIVYSSGPAFEQLSEHLLIPAFLWIGIAASVFLSLLAWRESGAHDQARRAAIELEASGETLRGALEHNRAILEGALDCIVTMDHRGLITEFNPAAERTFGFERNEVVGRPLAEVMAPAKHQSGDVSDASLFWQIGAGNFVGRRLEITATRKGGTEFPVELTITRNPGGDTPTFTGFIRDVTDLRRIERLLRQESEEKEQLLASERAARQDAERADRLKDEFLSTVSHELRTPLNAILGWAQLLKMGHLNSTESAQGIEVIERNVRVQAQIIEDLLDMSRIVSGKIRLDVQCTPLIPVIEAAIATVRPAAEAKAIRLQKVLDPAAGTIMGDANRLQQIVWNLLSNAIKFTPKQGRVQVTLARVNSHVEIVVADSGQGIAGEFLPFVFDRFRQADSSTTRVHGGLGLGLAIVKQLAELHGGTVRAASAGEGHGATFTVSLPVAMASDDGDANRVSTEAGSRNWVRYDLPVLKGIKVLAVDDEPDGLAVVKRFLEECEATVVTAGSAAEGLRLFQQERPHVVLSDIGMPEQNGYDFIRNIRALGPDVGGAVPAAAVTAFARSEDRRRAMIAGYQTHISKPVEPAELVAVVAALAGRTGR